MNAIQLGLLMAKLEEIRCCVIDVEEETKKIRLTSQSSRRNTVAPIELDEILQCPSCKATGKAEVFCC